MGEIAKITVHFSTETFKTRGEWNDGYRELTDNWQHRALYPIKSCVITEGELPIMKINKRTSRPLNQRM